MSRFKVFLGYDPAYPLWCIRPYAHNARWSIGPQILRLWRFGSPPATRWSSWIMQIVVLVGGESAHVEMFWWSFVGRQTFVTVLYATVYKLVFLRFIFSAHVNRPLGPIGSFMRRQSIGSRHKVSDRHHANPSGIGPLSDMEGPRGALKDER